MPVRLVHATASQPGAIAILQLHGECVPVLRAITGVHDWPLHRLRLVDLAGIDEGLALRLSEDVAQLMPHGGPRVVQRLTERLLELGAQIIANPADLSIDPRWIYPEAADRFEALALAAIARASSPLAIDLLLDQPRRWRAFAGGSGGAGPLAASRPSFSLQDQQRSRRLNRLIDPPIVVLVGAPNVGKSTLTNALAGRSLSIALDMPGTTRDYTAGRIDLGGLVVDWHDTPGLRSPDDTADPIEIKAIELARRLIARADLQIAMRDAEHDWTRLPRDPDLRVVNKIDLEPEQQNGRGAEQQGSELQSFRAAELQTCREATGHAKAVLRISAATGEGLAALVQAARDWLVPPADLAHDGPWLFDERLLQIER